jgi:hypothetical protein
MSLELTWRFKAVGGRLKSFLKSSSVCGPHTDRRTHRVVGIPERSGTAKRSCACAQDRVSPPRSLPFPAPDGSAPSGWRGRSALGGLLEASWAIPPGRHHVSGIHDIRQCVWDRASAGSSIPPAG